MSSFVQQKQCQSSMQSPLSIRTLASSTTPRFAASTAAGAMPHQPASRGGLIGRMQAAFGPVWAVIGIMGGMVGIACCVGIHTAKQQLLHSPSVQVSKRKRECVPEVDIPDAVVRSSDKFESKSFLRKVAQIQDKPTTIPTPRRDPSARRPREVETLKSVGVNN